MLPLLAVLFCRPAGQASHPGKGCGPRGGEGGLGDYDTEAALLVPGLPAALAPPTWAPQALHPLTSRVTFGGVRADVQMGLLLRLSLGSHVWVCSARSVVPTPEPSSPSFFPWPIVTSSLQQKHPIGLGQALALRGL